MGTTVDTERVKVVITYEDGHTDEFNPNKPKNLLAMERKYGVQIPEKHEHITWLAWHALGQPKGSLDAWLDDVEYIEEQGPKDDARDDEEDDEDSGEPDPS